MFLKASECLRSMTVARPQLSGTQSPPPALPLRQKPVEKPIADIQTSEETLLFTLVRTLLV